MEVEASLVGRTLASRYRIERCIGRGGMATVFAARIESGENAGKEIALKIVNRELTRDPTVLRRFHREAKAASRLKHPNTVEVYEYGVDGDDAFIAMELAPGSDLLQALAAENPMRQARAALVVSQVCAGLAAAHAEGIIHRDLKPENVMLIPDPTHPGGERVKVLDFGIAKIVESSKASGDDDQPSYVTKTALTRVGTIVGTPAYMSPEQCRGGELDGRSDVYSCGVLLYQLLTGEVPFTGETPLHTAMRHIHAQPKPPRELRRDLAPELEKIVLKALAKWPGERHQTAEMLGDELQAIVRSLPDAATLNLPVVIGKASDANAVLATELFIPSDPRMDNGALGAGKLGSVRLGSLGALQGQPRPAAGAPAAPAAPRPASGGPKPGTKSAPPATSGASAAGPATKAPASPPVARGAAGLGQGASLGRGASLATAPKPSDASGSARARPGNTPALSGGVPSQPAVASAGTTDKGVAPIATKLPALETPTDLRMSSLGDGASNSGTGPGARPATPAGPPRGFVRPGTEDPAAPRLTAKGGFARSTANTSAPQRASAARSDGRADDGAHDPPTLQKQDVASSSERRPTETGLTPTAQIPREKLVEHEEAMLQAAASGPTKSAPLESGGADDDDEPQTFIRAPQPGTDFEPFPEERPAHKTLVMDEPSHGSGANRLDQSGAHQAAQRLDQSSANLRAMAPTMDAPLDSARRNAIDSAWDEMSRKVNVGRDASNEYPGIHQSGQRLADLTSSSASLARVQMPGAPGMMQQPLDPRSATGPGASQLLRPLQSPQSPQNPAQLLPPLQPRHQSPSFSQAQGASSALSAGPTGSGVVPTAPMPMSGASPTSRPLPSPAGPPSSRDDFADVSSVSLVAMQSPAAEGNFGPIKSTIRLDMAAADAARNPYPVGASRAADRRGLRAKLEELSGAVLLLIGIAVGLFIALIGLVIVIFMK